MNKKKTSHQNKYKYSEMGSLTYNNIKLNQLFYNSIALLTEIPERKSSVSRKVLKELRMIYKKMQSLTSENKDRVQNKLLITEAILSQLEGNFQKSVQLIDRAIQLSEKEELYNDKILACELAAAFCKSQGFTDISNNYLEEAETTTNYEKTLIDKKQNNITNKHEVSNELIDTNLETLDLATVIHLSHFISSEIILEKLFENILKTLLENSGATKVILILMRKDELFVFAKGSKDKNEIFEKPIAIESFENIPISVINFINRSKETVILNNATKEGIFTSDPYIVKNQIKSILAYPLITQSNLRGIIYLENNLTSDAFLSDRVELIKLISTQAAISLENAQLFEKEREIEMQMQEQYEEIQAQYEEMESMNEELVETSQDLFHANKSLAIFQKFTNESSQGMAMADTSGKITYSNKVLAQMLGVKDASNLLNKKLSSFYTVETKQETIKNLLEEVIKGKEWVGELEIKSPDGKKIPVIQGFFSIKDEAENPQYLATIITDISNQKRLEEQLFQSQKLEAIGTLAGGIAHDFNNILTAIIGYSELILHDLIPSNEINFHINEIHKAAKTAATMTNQLLAFSRKQMLVPRILNINTIIKDMIKMLSRLIGENIKLITFLKEDLLEINADRGQIEQVIMNLVVNSRDAMIEGGTITITTGNKNISKEDVASIPNSRKGTFTCISIEDDGTGIDQETIEKIFEPFFTTKEVGKGTGLGLSVVYGIISQHNGWINVESRNEKGTVFHIYFPSTKIEKENEKNNEDKSKMPSTRGQGERILLIEDQPEVIRFVNKALTDNGYIVFQATNGKESKKIFKENKGNFDLIFSDVVLPDTSGLKLVDFFQEYNPHLPVLLTSGYSNEISQWEKIKEKGIHFLEKPYSLHELFNILTEIMIDRKI